MSTEQIAVDLLRRLTGNAAAEFKPGQWEAIRTVVEERRRALVVQRTGWGKSAVYLVATSLLRQAGCGPTVIVSPLLALMRNQLEMTERLGLVAHTVNSTNQDEWAAVFDDIQSDRLDLLLISPERLNNPVFVRDVGPRLFASIGLLVIDEVHCISDWGHDFRPDYRRLREVATNLPSGVPVLGTTATANDRVVADVEEQLGRDLAVYRGTLERESLALQVINMPDKAERMAWIAQTVPELNGSGIVYCLTIHDAETVGEWLRSVGIDAGTYTGATPHEQRLEVEEALSAGELKVVVATSALAMGYDNPRIEFVVHFQSPGSPIAYYQQVGRAGRAVESSRGVLMSGWEDTDIQNWFIDTAFPSEADTDVVLSSLTDQPGLRLRDLEGLVNLKRTRLEGMLKILEVEGAVHRDGSAWFRSSSNWEYPRDRIDEVTQHRRAEQAAMAEYVQTDRCLMEFLREELDDPGSQPCGRCQNCTGTGLAIELDRGLVQEALEVSTNRQLLIPPRKRLPCELDAAIDLRGTTHEVGRALTRWGDPGLAVLVEHGMFRDGRFDDDLVEALVRLIGDWSPVASPTWLSWVPSSRGSWVEDLAWRLGDELALPVVSALERVRDTPPQREMANSCQQARNVAAALRVGEVRPGPMFLVDDTVDSRWTFTIAGSLLRSAGAGPVFPVAVSDTSNQ